MPSRVSRASRDGRPTSGRPTLSWKRPPWPRPAPPRTTTQACSCDRRALLRARPASLPARSRASRNLPAICRSRRRCARSTCSGATPPRRVTPSTRRAPTRRHIGTASRSSPSRPVTSSANSTSNPTAQTSNRAISPTCSRATTSGARRFAEVGPDGHAWVIDWYYYIVQHNPTPRDFRNGAGNAYENELRDQRHGRIYRVVWKAGKTSPQPNLVGRHARDAGRCPAQREFALASSRPTPARSSAAARMSSPRSSNS
jgi:hypothetical protein